jgi:ATP-dependent Clp protease ATP-binding subunit ClpC
MSTKSSALDAPLDLNVLLVLRELWNGDVVAFPAADPSLVSYAQGAAAAIAEQRMVLPEYLAEADPEVLARHALPSGTRLVEVEVVVPREDLPERLAVRTPIAVSCIAVPAVAGRPPETTDAWVFVPTLDHTFYLSATERLEDVLAQEVRRIAAAQERGPLGYLRLLPAAKERIESLSVAVERAGRDARGSGRAGSLRQSYAEEKKRRSAEAILESVGTALHLSAEARSGPPLVGRDRELRALTALLGGSERLSAALVGPELVGKSALFWAWLRSQRKTPRPVYATSGAQLVAGKSGLGQWQERVRRVMDAAAQIDAVVVFDNLADLFGDQPGSSVDLADAIRPYLEENKVRLVGEVTPEALDLFESRHVGFFANLNRLKLEPLGAAETRELLRARIAHADKVEPERPNLAPEAVGPLIDLAERYLPYRPFPGKAVRFYEQLRAAADKERDPTGARTAIGPERVLEAFGVETGIPVFLLREDRPLYASHKDGVLGFFQQRIIGQDDAVRRVVDTICVVKAGLQPSGKPLASFLFVGPTGVGKTELARTLATFLFGSPERLMRFDMSEYMDVFAAERLIRGTDRAEGLLTRRIRQQPFSVLLLDEIEKADPAVFDLLLQVLGEGRLTDARGKTAFFHNAIIIMTSNLGTADRKARIGVGASPASDDEHYQSAVNRSFRPEFVNRLDRIVAFRELQPAEVAAVCRVAVERLKHRRGLTEQGIELAVGDRALARLAELGYSEAYGARALRRAIDDHLVAPVARLLGRLGPDARQGTIVVEGEPAAPNGLSIELERKSAGAARREVRGVEGIMNVRRRIDRWLELDSVAQVKEQLGFIVSQLSYGRGANAEDPRSSRELAELQVEHHRLSEVYTKAVELRGEIEAIEELALGALYSSSAEDMLDLRPEAEQVQRRFQHNLVYVLLALEKHRDQSTMLVQELDQGRAFDRWLVPLIEDAERRGWNLTLHVAGMPADAAESWPADRRFGPPRAARLVLPLLKHPDRAMPQSVLLRASGPYAGVLLALEAGLHRWYPFDPSGEPTKMLIHRVAPRASIKEEDWIKEALTPPPPPPETELRARSAVREWRPKEGKLSLVGRRREVELEPWEYWRRFEEIALEHLILFEDGELERGELAVNRLDAGGPG